MFVLLLQSLLTTEVQASAEREAQTLSVQFEASGVASELDDLADDGFVQVVDGVGTVIAASDDFIATASVTDGTVLLDGERFVVVSVPFDLDVMFTDTDSDSDNDNDTDGDDSAVDREDSARVVVGRSLDSVAETTGTVIGLLAIATPLLIAVVGFTTFIVVGRALTPVEKMRRQVDSVTGTNLDQRVDDPQSEDEIGRLARTMNAMLERLDNSQRAQRQFISDASHELKSPLAALRQYAEVADAHPDRFTSAELVDAMLDEGGRLERLVQGMLVLARADERALAVPTVAVDLDDPVLAEGARIRATTNLRVDVSGVSPSRVMGDAGLLSQIVRNLLDNAARHARSSVTLALSTDAATVLLVVDDDGDGIAPDDRERVFERFRRLDDARARDSGGSGLGLAIVREIVAAHGGTVRVTESPSGGARFEVRMPAASTL